MTGKAVLDRPWYLTQCRVCRQLKHILEFRIRKARPGELLRCRLCDEVVREEHHQALQSMTER